MEDNIAYLDPKYNTLDEYLEDVKNKPVIDINLSPEIQLSPEQLAERRKAEFEKHQRDLKVGNWARAHIEGKGLKGLSAEDRALFEKEYNDKIQGLSEEDQNQFMSNAIFKYAFEGQNDWRKDAWDRRNVMSKDERDIYIAKAISQGLITDEISDAKRNGPSYGDAIVNLFSGDNRSLGERFTGSALIAANKTSLYAYNDIKDKASKFLREQKDKIFKPHAINIVNNMDGKQRDELIGQLEDIADETSNYYKRYKGTSRLDMSSNDRLNMLADYIASNMMLDENFANEQLSGFIQDKVAESQSWVGAMGNGVIGAATKILGSIAETAGMGYGAFYGLFANHEDGNGLNYFEEWLTGVVDNPIARWGADIQTTNSFLSWKQEEYKKQGISAFPILNTRSQEESYLSWNTIPEMLDQFGFTLAYMTEAGWLSKGARAAAKAGAKKIATNFAKKSAKGLSVEERKVLLENARKNIRRISNTERVVQAGIPGFLGGVEGGLNALDFYDGEVERLENQIDKEFSDRVFNDISNYAETNPTASIAALNDLGLDVRQLMIPAGDINPETQRRRYSEEQINLIKQMLLSNENIINVFRDRYKKEEKAAKDDIENQVRKRFLSVFYENSMTNGLLNTLFMGALHSPYIRKASGSWSNPLNKQVNIKRTAEGEFKAEAKRGGRSELVKQQAKLFAGEGTEEYVPAISSNFEEARSENKMHQYIDYLVGNETQSADDFSASSMEMFKAGFNALAEHFDDFSNLKEALYGGMAAVFMPKFHFKRNKNGNKWYNKFSIHESGSAWSLIGASEGKAISEENQKVANEINKFFENKDIQTILKGYKAGISLVDQVQDAIANYDEKVAKDGVAGLFANFAIMFNNMKGTIFHDAVMNNLRGIQSFDKKNLENQESEEYKAALQYQQDKEANPNEISIEEAFDKLVRNANNTLDALEKYEKYSKSFDRKYGHNISFVVKNAVVFNELLIDDMNKRIKDLEGEINPIVSQAQQEDKSTRSGLSTEQAVKIAKYGNGQNLRNKISKAEKNIEALKKELKEVKDLLEEAKTAEVKSKYGRMEDDINSKIAKNEKAKKEAEELLNSITDGQNKVLSFSEILALPADVRAYMLAAEGIYSKEQTEEINKAKKFLADNSNRQEGEDLNQKVIDLGRIYRSLDHALEQQFKNETDFNELTEYTKRAALAFSKDIAREKYKDLLELENQGDYEGFISRLKEAILNADDFDTYVLDEMLKDSEFIKRYRDELDLREKFLEELKEQNKDKYNNQVEDDNSFFNKALDLLFENNIDPKDVEKAVEFLINKQAELGFSIGPNPIFGEFIQQYRYIINSYLEKKTKNEHLQSDETNKPAETPIAAETKRQAEEAQKEKDKKALEQIKDFDTNKLKNDYKKNIARLLRNYINDEKDLKNLGVSLSEEDRLKIEKIIRDVEFDAGLDYESVEDLFLKVKEEIRKIGDIKGIENLFKVLQRDIDSWNRKFNSNIERINRGERYKPENVFNDTPTSTPPASTPSSRTQPGTPSSITSAPVALVKGTSGITSKFKSWKIVEFLRDNHINPNEEVFVLTSGELNFQDYDLGLVYAVKSKKGPIVINGESYQPIGVARANESKVRNDDGTYSTNTNTYESSLREDARKQLESSDGNTQNSNEYIIVNEGGKPVTLKYKEIKFTVPEQYRGRAGNNNRQKSFKHHVDEEFFTEKEKEDLPNAVKNFEDSLLERLIVKNGMLYYRSRNGHDIALFRQKIKKDNNDALNEAILSGNVKNFNRLTSRSYKALTETGINIAGMTDEELAKFSIKMNEAFGKSLVIPDGDSYELAREDGKLYIFYNSTDAEGNPIRNKISEKNIVPNNTSDFAEQLLARLFENVLEVNTDAEWNVNFNLIEMVQREQDVNRRKGYINSIKSWYSDDLLRMNEDSYLEMIPGSVELETPKKKKDNLNRLGVKDNDGSTPNSNEALPQVKVGKATTGEEQHKSMLTDLNNIAKSIKNRVLVEKNGSYVDEATNETFYNIHSSEQSEAEQKVKQGKRYQASKEKIKNDQKKERPKLAVEFTYGAEVHEDVILTVPWTINGNNVNLYVKADMLVVDNDGNVNVYIETFGERNEQEIAEKSLLAINAIAKQFNIPSSSINITEVNFSPNRNVRKEYKIDGSINSYVESLNKKIASLVNDSQDSKQDNVSSTKVEEVKESTNESLGKIKWSELTGPQKYKLKDRLGVNPETNKKYTLDEARKHFMSLTSEEQNKLIECSK